MEPKPIKRNEHIVPLSREHHYGLLFCWKIRTGLTKGVDLARIKAYINYFWNVHLEQHFHQEETLLFNQIDAPLCTEAKAQHADIIAGIQVLNSTEADDPAAYAAFEVLVNKHIRLEEREVFPFLESVLSDEALSAVGRELLRSGEDGVTDDYEDEFWTTPK